jgi:2-dehydropantoate 2-reductase
MKQKINNITVVGIGGVGGYFGGLLSSSVNDQQVTFVARGEHGEKVKAQGLKLEMTDKTVICNPQKITNKISEIVNPDLVILCTKSYDLEDVVKQLDEVISENTILLPLLNGVDICDRIRKVTKKGVLLPACVYIAAHISSPGVIVISGPQGAIISGSDKENKNFNPDALTKLFENTGFKFKWVEEPYQAIWEKYAYVASFAVVTGYSGKSFVEVVNDKNLLDLLEKVMNEILSLAKAKGINMPEGFFDKSVKRSSLLSPEARTSFSRDIEKGKKSEIDVFGYTIINMGKEYGVGTPVTMRLVKEIELRVKNQESRTKNQEPRTKNK